MTAEWTLRGQPRGNEREWDGAIGGMSRLPEKSQAESLGDSISL
jgi:hypothetical protein